MAPRPTSARELRAAVERLTGLKGRAGNEVRLYRVPFTASDGEPSSIIIRVSGKKFFRNTVDQLADTIRCERADIEAALDWTPQQLVAHLSRYPGVVYSTPAIQRLFRQFAGG